MEPNKTNQTFERYESINGLRVFAAIGILILHVFSNMPVKPAQSIFTDAINIIFPGFTIMFMTLSGFSLFCGYYHRFKENRISLNDFYTKRYKKTLPFFGFITLLDLVVSPSIGSAYEAFANFTLAFGLLPDAGNIEVIGVGWFLGVLFLFYMLFPFFVFLLDNKRRGWFILALSIIFSTIGSSYFGINRTNMIYSAPYFILGGMIFLYKESIKSIIRKYSGLAFAICIASILIYLYVYVFRKFELYNFESKMFIFCLWLIYAIGADNKLMHNKVIDYICNFRLEIYLSHMVIFRAIEKVHLENYITQPDVLFITVLAATIIGTIIFSHITKNIIFPKTINKWIKI